MKGVYFTPPPSFSNIYFQKTKLGVSGTQIMKMLTRKLHYLPFNNNINTQHACISTINTYQEHSSSEENEINCGITSGRSQYTEHPKQYNQISIPTLKVSDEWGLRKTSRIGSVFQTMKAIPLNSDKYKFLDKKML